MTFITHGFRVSDVSDVRERVQDLGSPLHFMLRRSSLKSSRQIDAVGHAEQACSAPFTVWGPLKAPRSSGINGAKSCILAIGLSWHLISLLKLHFFVLFFSYIFFYIFLITCITVYSLLFEKAVQWTLFTSLFAWHHHSVFDNGAPYRRNVYNFVRRHSELIVIFLKKLEKTENM